MSAEKKQNTSPGLNSAQWVRYQVSETPLSALFAVLDRLPLVLTYPMCPHTPRVLQLFQIMHMYVNVKDLVHSAWPRLIFFCVAFIEKSPVILVCDAALSVARDSEWLTAAKTSVSANLKHFEISISTAQSARQTSTPGSSCTCAVSGNTTNALENKNFGHQLFYMCMCSLESIHIRQRFIWASVCPWTNLCICTWVSQFPCWCWELTDCSVTELGD